MASGEGNINSCLWAEMRRWFGDSVRVLLPMVCSALLLYWLFRRVNVRDMLAVLSHDVDYWWLALMLLFNYSTYVIRGVRWGLQLEGVGIHVCRQSLCVSIYGAYALNMLFSGFGETWRCIFISKHRHAPLTTVIGTALGDRLTDLVCVLLILLLTFMLSCTDIHDLITHYAICRDTQHVLDDPWVWGGTIAIVTACWGVGHFLKNYKVVCTLDSWCENIWQGLKVIVTMNHKTLYTLLTIAIWICYFMEMYVSFFAFPFTRQLVTPELGYGMLPALVALLFSSMSMAIPSSGGLGPWNIAVIFALTLYGVGQTQAAAFAMLVWGLQAVLQVGLGIYSMVYVSRLK